MSAPENNRVHLLVHPYFHFRTHVDLALQDADIPRTLSGTKILDAPQQTASLVRKQVEILLARDRESGSHFFIKGHRPNWDPTVDSTYETTAAAVLHSTTAIRNLYQELLTTIGSSPAIVLRPWNVEQRSEQWMLSDVDLELIYSLQRRNDAQTVLFPANGEERATLPYVGGSDSMKDKAYKQALLQTIVPVLQGMQQTSRQPLDVFVSGEYLDKCVIHYSVPLCEAAGVRPPTMLAKYSLLSRTGLPPTDIDDADDAIVHSPNAEAQFQLFWDEL